MLTQARLRQLLSYDPATGEFRWRAGAKAGKMTRNSWVDIEVDGWSYGAHRLAWLYVHGEMPDDVAHLNRVRTDNRIENLSAGEQVAGWAKR